MEKVKVKDLRIKVTYEVHQLGVELPKKLYLRMKKVADRNQQIELQSYYHHEVEEWLSRNITQRDCCESIFEFMELSLEEEE